MADLKREQGEEQYLEKKQDRTTKEFERLLALRLDSDQTPDDAMLFIAYRASGMFRRVIIDNMTGKELKQLLQDKENRL